ncbi:MAG TPA: IS5 family transposase [Rhodospirillales bacterium]|nr:IS5 family transposase [Rhodospirillales bacterium]
MRGGEVRSGSLFSYVDLESRVPGGHPLRTIRTIVDEALARLDDEFAAIYAPIGRPSIPPEQVLRALLLQAFYSVRSERQVMEQLDYNLLFRWFVGLGIDDPVWDVTVFTKNRDRLLGGEIAAKVFGAVLDQARVRGLLSDEHFSVDGTLIQAWASLKSFRRKDGSDEPPTPGRNGERDFKGEKRSNETHRSTTDADARLFRKGDGQASQLCFIGHVLMENRNGLAVGTELTRAAGSAERLAALAMTENLAAGHKTLGADKGYDTQDFVMELRELGVTPHVAQNAYQTQTARRRSAIDGRTTRHEGYLVSQKKRKRIEEIFGWLKTIGGQRQTRFRGLDRVKMAFTFALAAYNLIRMPKLMAKTA